MATPIVQKVQSHPHLVRDEASKAIINKNTTDYDRRHHFKKHHKKKEEELAALKADVALLKKQVADLLAKANPAPITPTPSS